MTNIIMVLAVFGVLMTLYIFLEKTKGDRNPFSARAVNSLPKISETVQLKTGKTITVFNKEAQVDAPLRFRKAKRKKFTLHNSTELDQQYIQEIMQLLEEFLTYSLQDASFKALQKRAELILRYVLEWLCRRNTQIPKEKYDKIYSYDLAQLLATIYPHEPQLMQAWYKQLANWSEKFAGTGRYQLPLKPRDLPQFKGFILLFLHSIRERAKELNRLMNENYPIELTPQQDLAIQAKVTQQDRKLKDSNSRQIYSAKDSNSRQIHRVKGSDPKPCCPICNKPFRKNRRGVWLCPPCNYYKEYIELGYIVDSYQHEPYLLELLGFKKHSIILGVPGEGKSNTGLWIAYQLREHGVPIWVFECEGEQWRNLIGMRMRNPKAVKKVMQFTIRNRFINPFCLNPLQPPTGVHLEQHMEDFANDFSFAYDLEPWAAAKLREALINLYRKKGWDITMSALLRKEGNYSYPLPIELIDSVEEVLEGEYATRERQNLMGYLRTRVRDFNRLSLGYMWNTRNNIPWEELFTSNVVFELQELDGYTKQFFACIMLSMVFEYMRVLGETKDLRIVIIIEEASDLLAKEMRSENNRVVGGKTIEIIEKLFSQSRKYGVGLVIMDQTPERLPFRVRALPRTGIIHNLTNKDSIQMVYNIFRDIRYLEQTKIGEAFVVHPGRPGSMKVKVPKFPTRKISDKEIIKYMEPFYETYPWFKKPDPDIEEKIRALIAEGEINTKSKDYEDFLMGLTTDDVDCSSGIHPLKADTICAKIELDLVSCVKSIHNFFHENRIIDDSFKRTMRRKFETSPIQKEIREFQSKLMNVKTIEGFKEITHAFYPKIRNLITKTSPASTFLPSIRYFFRLVAFKYLRFDTNKRTALFYELLELLIQTLTSQKRR